MPLLYNISQYGLLSKPGEDPRNPLTKYCLQKIAQRKIPNSCIDYIRYKITNWQIFLTGKLGNCAAEISKIDYIITTVKHAI
jgi:hypothetical protein